MLAIPVLVLQEDNLGIDHPVCYFSRKFTCHQLNYSTIEKEALALVLAHQHFEVYIGSNSEKLVVFTDHNTLVFLNQNTNQCLMRWALLVKNYNLTIKHKRVQSVSEKLHMVQQTFLCSTCKHKRYLTVCLRIWPVFYCHCVQCDM